MAASVQTASEQLEVAPNIWAGVGLLRNGVGMAPVGCYVDLRCPEQQRCR